MSWDIDIPIIVRTLINDLSEPYTYSDQRLLQVIVVAAKYVQFDVVLDHSYIVDLSNPTITPDPTDDDDDIFLSLVSLKTACLIDQSNLRARAAAEGIKASLGPASLTVKGNLEGFLKILEQGPCASYDELVSHWDVAQATTARAILSPFVGNKFDPRSLFSDNRGRDLY